MHQSENSGNRRQKLVRVSAIITTYNRAGLLPRAVQSVVSQTFTDYEVIIVDDGSTDHTQEVVAALDHPRLRSFRHEASRGQSAAINAGIDSRSRRVRGFSRRRRRMASV